MKIAGFQKTSFVDFPKMVSSVVFTPGCNMNCAFCHNRHILTGEVELIDELTVFEYLKKRKGSVNGVVISGGEPTLMNDIEDFAERVKSMGFLLKLDTNGTSPDVLKKLFDKKLIDYVAMDIKAPYERYAEITRVSVDTDRIKDSVSLIRNSGISHEFRTTFCPELCTDDVLKISGDIVKDSEYYLQQYRQVEGGGQPHTSEYVVQTAALVKQNGGKCTVRGV